MKAKTRVAIRPSYSQSRYKSPPLMPRLFTLSFALMLSLPAWAQRVSPFTWDSVTLAPGRSEMQLWLTPRSGRTDTTYLQNDLRVQTSFGLSDHLDTLFGFDIDLISFGTNSRTLDSRVSNTLRYAPFKATGPVGFAVISRVAVGFALGEVEVRLVLDKSIGPVHLALNASGSRAILWHTAQVIDLRFEQNLTLRYLVGESFAAGFDVRAREAFASTTYQGTAFSAGPAFTYSAPRWWFALGLLAQAGADKAKGDYGNGDPLELRDNERFVGRVILGVKL